MAEYTFETLLTGPPPLPKFRVGRPIGRGSLSIRRDSNVPILIHHHYPQFFMGFRRVGDEAMFLQVVHLSGSLVRILAVNLRGRHLIVCVQRNEEIPGSGDRPRNGGGRWVWLR